MDTTSSAVPPPPAGRRRKVLVVDDNAIVLKTLALKLKSNGYDVSTAMDGPEAISFVRKEKPDLILMDVSFPPDVGHGGGVAWDGFLIMDWVRRIEEAKHIPFIVITGGDPVKYEKRSRDAGAVAFFRKPIDHEGLISAIRRTLGETTEPPTPGFDTTNFEI
ncbi:MAG: response regulator [Verrucomicrobia bacterium]|nr:response regulator [Verrucomicrobiota bacterium]